MRRLVAAFALIVLVLSQPGVQAQAAPSANGFDAIDRYVQEQMDGSRIPGVSIAIVEGGRVLHARGFGNDGRGHDVTKDTPFWIGSNTKSFTALAAMQLVEAGKLDLDTPVQRYLPRFRTADPEASARITVRHLLNQTPKRRLALPSGTCSTRPAASPGSPASSRYSSNGCRRSKRPSLTCVTLS
jgi:CubicO group peptidase (beta-lactamase class C family)